MGLTFDALPEVAVIRDLLRRWWGLELGLAAADGSAYTRSSHATCETVRGAVDRIVPRPSGRGTAEVTLDRIVPRPSGRGTAEVTKEAACDAAMRELAAGFQKSKQRGAVVKTCHAGLVMFAAPVLGDRGVSGVVFATGGRTGPTNLVAAIGCTPEEAASLETVVPQLDEPAVVRIQDLVTLAAAAVERAQPAEIPPTTWTHPFSEIVGEAPAVREVVKLLAKVVKSEATVLVHGESGTGKELIARAIHYHGPRAKRTFVVQNCSAFNDNLLESALFGHVRGAFTGAVKDQKGLFEVADGGTFFLDEIGDMSAALQVKLLRVLQEGTFMPVGGTKPVKVDVRIIAASHKDLQTMVAHKQFREDLFYRVNVLKITVPPLRDRVADIPRLAAHFVAKHWKGPNPPRLSQGALSRLVAYPWPGNIRELENEMERMLVLAGDAQELTGNMVSARVAGGSSSLGRPLHDVVANAEADAIVASLGRHQGDREAAAAELGVSHPYLDARMAALGLGASS